MKKLTLTAVGLLFALSMTACSGPEKAPQGTEDLAASTETTTSAAASGQETEASGASTENEPLYCIVNEVTPEKINVSDMSGNSYDFPVENAELELNDMIFVTYTGDLEDPNSTIVVLNIEKYVSEE